MSSQWGRIQPERLGQERFQREMVVESHYGVITVKR